MATYTFRKEFSEKPDTDIAQAFDNFRSQPHCFDPDLIVQWLGQHDVLLIIDELNNLTGLTDPKRKAEAQVFGEFLKTHFLAPAGRYFVFSSHRLSTLGDFAEFINSSDGSFRQVVLWELPLVENLEIATEFLYNELQGAREAVYFGLMPGMVYARGQKRKIDGKRKSVLKTLFSDTTQKEQEATFIAINCSSVTGNLRGVPEPLLLLCHGCPDSLGDGKIRWVPFHLEYVMGSFARHSNFGIRKLSTALVDLCKQLVGAKEKSGEGWEGLFVVFLLARCVANISDQLFLPQDWFADNSVTIHYNNYFNYKRNMDQCTNWNELPEGIKATQRPTLSILYPTHAQFEAYDAIAVYSKDNKMVIYGYQLKEGKATSNQPVHSSFAKSFVVKGASTKTFKMSDAWCIPGTKEIDSFFGPCGVHWTPQAWATLLKKNLKKNV